MKIKNSLKIIINVLKYLFLGILLLLLIVFSYHKFIKKDNLIQFSNYYIFQIASGSMKNELNVLDFILVKKLDTYKVSDIVTYKDDNTYVTHRIVSKKNKKIVTKGDANNIEDEPITEDMIIGKYILKLNLLTFIYKYKILFIGLILIITILDGLKNRNGS